MALSLKHNLVFPTAPTRQMGLGAPAVARADALTARLAIRHSLASAPGSIVAITAKPASPVSGRTWFAVLMGQKPPTSSTVMILAQPPRGRPILINSGSIMPMEVWRWEPNSATTHRVDRRCRTVLHAKVKQTRWIRLSHLHLVIRTRIFCSEHSSRH
jgi:hypothetical protein